MATLKLGRFYQIEGEPHGSEGPRITIMLNRGTLSTWLHDLTPGQARQFARDILNVTGATETFRREFRKKGK